MLKRLRLSWESSRNHRSSFCLLRKGPEAGQQWQAEELGFCFEGDERHELPGCLSGKDSTCSVEDARDKGLIPGSGRSPGGGNGNPFP